MNLPKRCSKCGKMVKAGAPLCGCGYPQPGAICVDLSKFPRIRRFLERAAVKKGMTMSEVILGYMGLGIKTCLKP